MPGVKSVDLPQAVVDQLRSVSDASGNVTSISYDSLGRKRTMNDVDMGAWSYSYDANGNLLTQSDAQGQTLWMGYDALNRLTAKRVGSASGTLLASYGYDAGTNRLGQRTSMSVPGGASSWSYDARGRKISATDSIPGLAGTRSFGWAYDSADRLTTLTYPSLGGLSEHLTYSYDAAWRPSSLCSDPTGHPCYVNGASYTALDQPDGWSLGNSLTQKGVV